MTGHHRVVPDTRCTPGALVVADGRVEWVGPRRDLPARYAGADRVDHGDSLITPGFVDTHVHLAQVDAIASPGHQLLPWLEHSMYPAEMRFADLDYARRAGWFFCDTLLSVGTTTGVRSRPSTSTSARTGRWTSAAS
ncbi:imidazolonepropionase-like domain-containing protein [Saccharothrix xinjiangensis]|uniref:Aminodeoxyfutalosine deaminase/Imidazolonepropionase-like composite domain-containing protein n=1 Tax=Saccharothrix xinjiangensis TaxID=204798 RepID=A0ABV9Y6U7_9PSEU